MEIIGCHCHEVEFTVGLGEGNRTLRNYLTGYKKLSQKALKKLKNQGEVLVNGEAALLINTIGEGDHILLRYPPEGESPYLSPERVPLNIVYEDEEILVLDKQAGVCVHPTKGHPGGTLANGILYHWQERGWKYKPHFVSRLDKDTSGLILIAKSTYGAQQFFVQQHKGIIQRSYLAVIQGELEQDRGTINLPIVRMWGQTTKRMVRFDGQPSVTHYKVVERFSGYTLLEIKLETGRTHQIRVHFSHLGNPLVGDSMYGGEWHLLPRQFLHAHSLSFLHPLSEKEMGFKSTLPEDLKESLKHLSIGL